MHFRVTLFFGLLIRTPFAYAETNQPKILNDRIIFYDGRTIKITQQELRLRLEIAPENTAKDLLVRVIKKDPKKFYLMPDRMR